MLTVDKSSFCLVSTQVIAKKMAAFKNYLLVAVISVTFAQDIDENASSALQQLLDMMASASMNVTNTFEKIATVGDGYDEIVKERLECIEGEYLNQRSAVNKTIIEATSQGMLKNKQFSSFQCIANAGQEGLDKLDNVNSQIPENLKRIKEKYLVGIRSFTTVLTGLYYYCDVIIWEIDPNPGKIKMYTSGCPKNQNKCWYKRGSPPPIGSKNEVFKFRSIKSMVIAPANRGNDTNNNTAVIKTDQQNKDFYTKKSNEIKAAENEAAIKKILAEAEGKVKLLGGILQQINTKVRESKFKFFEEFVDFLHKSENSMRKIQRESSQKLMFCVF